MAGFKSSAINEAKILTELASEAMSLHAKLAALVGDNPKYVDAQVKVFEASQILASAADEVKQHIAYSNVT